MAQKYKLKYYKFLIYFFLWASAILTFAAGILQLSGLVWELSGVAAAEIYAVMPAYRVVDISYGGMQILVAIMTIVARFKLARFKKSAPVFYIILLVISMIMPIIYAIASAIILEVGFLEIFDFAGCIGNIIGIIVNSIYFGKRKSLFKQ